MPEQTLINLVEKLYPFHYRLIGPGNDEAVPKYMEELDFTVHEFEEEQELNGWVIPRSEVVTKAEIRKDGEVIYDGLANPLGVILMCIPFEGSVGLEELQKHLYFHDTNPQAIPFHCTQQYRPGKNDWGFCVPQTFYDGLEDGEYEVQIEVEHKPTTMKVLDYILPGESDETIVFQAHNCHPFQANDDISGCAVGIRLLQELAKQKNRRYTYRLLICPELTGTLFWLDKVVREGTNIKGVAILAALGNSEDLRLQESFTGTSFLDNAAHYALKQKYGSYDYGAFRTVYGNDETIFEAPGYEIPTISLTRYPFHHYHSHFDTPDTLSENRLEKAVETLLDITAFLEKNQKLVFTGEGLYCLSHPRYDLYKKVWDPSDRDGPKNRKEGRNWNMLMTNLPRQMDGKTTVYDLAVQYDLPYEEVYEYCMKWVECGLAEIKR